MNKLTDQISKAASISIGTRGLDIKLAAVNTRVTAIQAAQDQAKSSSARGRMSSRRDEEHASSSEDIPARLRELASEYLNIEIPHYRARVRRKNELAHEMGDVVLEANVSRELLVSTGDEGLIVAFAAAVVGEPGMHDLNLLLGTQGIANRLHVRYRLVLALAVLINRGFVVDADRERVDAALTAFDKGADASLSKLISDTRSLLLEVAAGEIQTEL
ncbi:hypothetical protein [Bradyrhizobium quebecense]|uniref:Uncharacterized protein n=2 Tax=Bradyrhizobium quebecense TaxID=2748629 RepID=A0ACD3V7Q4_9BRAD|nr:hypothetical protein [Bradyrhizobium quebecense]UGY02521.1 hypothetical protein J4P68_0036480 [Bradyrhizobium quebecense]